jgi:MYXO-CTERM domain-containing protein
MEFQMRNKTFISSMVGIAAAVAVAGSANAAAVSVWTFGLTPTATFNTPNPTSNTNSKASSGNASGLWNGYYAEVYALGSDMIATSASMQFAVGSSVDAYAMLTLDSIAGANLLGVTDFQFNVTAYTGGATLWEIVATDINANLVNSGRVSTSGTGQKTFAVSSFTQFPGSTGFDWSQVTSMNFNVYSTGAATSFTFDSWTAAVPAPGALALLGVAGLVGARRRRA